MGNLHRLTPNLCDPPASASMSWGYQHEPPGLAHLISKSNFTTACLCRYNHTVYQAQYRLSTGLNSFRHPLGTECLGEDPLLLRDTMVLDFGCIAVCCLVHCAVFRNFLSIAYHMQCAHVHTHTHLHCDNPNTTRH